MADVQRTIGRYELMRPIGIGGMAVVYLARQTDLDRLVAVKELRDFEDADPGLAERFIRESRVSGRLAHQNIVTVHDYCQYAGIPYIVMEYLRLGSLRPFVESLTMPQVAGVLEGMLSALAYAEREGVVHRDIKPENVMVTDDGRVKIADFGIAKHVASSTTRFRTKTGQAIGTPTYMSPEQALADTDAIGPRSDLYAVGVMAYEMLLGRPPFAADNPVRVIWQHVNDPIPPPLELRPGLNPATAAWLEQMLEKAPEDRPAGADAAWRALEDALSEELDWRWRREARLLPASPDAGTPRPLTPAPFSEERAAEERDTPPPEPTTPPASAPPRGRDESFVTFVPGGAARGPVPGAGARPAGAPAARGATPPADAAPPPGADAPAPGQAADAPGGPPPDDVPGDAGPEATDLMTWAPKGAAAAGAAARARPAAPADAPGGEEGAQAPVDAPGRATDTPTRAPGDAEAGAPPADAAGRAADAPTRAPGDGDAAPPPAGADESADRDEAARAGDAGAPPSLPPQELKTIFPAPRPAPAAKPAPDERAAAHTTPPSTSGPPLPPSPPPADTPPRRREPEPAPAREQEEPEPKRPAAWRRALPFAAAAVVVGAVLGVLAGGGSGDDPPAASELASAGLRAEVPADFSPAASAPSLPGLPLRDAQAVERGDGNAATVVLGRAGAGASTPALLPDRFLAAARGEQRTAVDLGDAQAFRYTGVQLPGQDGAATVFAIPTSDDVAVVACLGAGAGERECEGIATSLRVTDGRALPVGPSLDHAAAVSDVDERLTGALRRARRGLDASTAADQAAAAAAVAKAYADAAGAVRKLRPGPADRAATAALATALSGTAAAYRRVAAQAKAEDTAGHAAAAAAAEKRERGVRAALRDFQAAGYEVR